MLKTESLGKAQGFTLIELVIVIVLIGILSAAALPKFANLTLQARNASNQGVAGALSAAVNIAHSAWIAAGATSTVGNVTLEGGAIVPLNANGWPRAADQSGCITSWNAILSTAAPQAATSCDNPNNCYVAAFDATASTCVYSLPADPTSATKITYNPATGAVTSTLATSL